MAARCTWLLVVPLLAGCQRPYSITAVNLSSENIGVDVVARNSIFEDSRIADVVLGPGGRFEWSTIASGRIEAKITRLREGSVGEPLMVAIPKGGSLQVEISTDEKGLVLNEVHAKPPEKP